MIATNEGPGRIPLLTWAFGLERVKGIEPSLSAWEADVLPLNYTRERPPLYLIGRRGARTIPLPLP